MKLAQELLAEHLWRFLPPEPSQPILDVRQLIAIQRSPGFYRSDPQPLWSFQSS